MDVSELMKKQEDLHADLAEQIEEHDVFGQIIRHPLLFAVPYHPALNAMYNEQYEAKRQAIARRVEENDWHAVMTLHERAYRFQSFCEYMDRMDDAAYWSVLADIWVDSENLWQYNSVIPSLVNGRSNPGQMMSDRDRAIFDSLPERIVVYRGHNGHNQAGWSWSLSEAKAQWFSRRFGQRNSGVIRGVLKKSLIVAFLSRRGEFEVIAKPQHVRLKKPVSQLKRSGYLHDVLDLARRQFRLGKNSFHGPDHWERVERNAIVLCGGNENADLEVCRLFAILHDCQRMDEDEDPDHGRRAAAWIRENLKVVPVRDDRLELLLEACSRHNDGLVSDDPTIGTCWDADRMDLPRVGITPNPSLLSTQVARKMLWNV